MTLRAARDVLPRARSSCTLVGICWSMAACSPSENLGEQDPDPVEHVPVCTSPARDPIDLAITFPGKRVLARDGLASVAVPVDPELLGWRVEAADPKNVDVVRDHDVTLSLVEPNLLALRENGPSRVTLPFATPISSGRVRVSSSGGQSQALRNFVPLKSAAAPQGDGIHRNTIRIVADLCTQKFAIDQRLERKDALIHHPFEESLQKLSRLAVEVEDTPSIEGAAYLNSMVVEGSVYESAELDTMIRARRATMTKATPIAGPPRDPLRNSLSIFVNIAHADHRCTRTDRNFRRSRSQVWTFGSGMDIAAMAQNRSCNIR